MTKLIDISGQRFGKWVVLRRAGYQRSGTTGFATWLCRCECGTEREVRGCNLKTGSTRSCGCAGGKGPLRHGETRGRINTRLYTMWVNMRQRCSNPNCTHWKSYGGRGITVCGEWAQGFEPFRDWALANGYASHLTIDREDNDGNYQPSNCRFVTNRVNCNNQRKSRFVEYNGERMTVSQLADRIGMHRETFRMRIVGGMTVEEAVHTPVRHR